MEELDARRRKAAAFLLVFLLHGLLLETLIQKSRRIFRKSDVTQALLVYFLPRTAPPVSDARKIPVPSKMPDTGSTSNGKTPSNSAIAPPIETAPTTPLIDWQNELEAVAQNRESAADRTKAYRDLSRSMSPAQLDWLKQHRMEPANPGITWKRPRVEITQDGLPIVHINDQCVLVPILLIPMVFCSIGHVEPNGTLFEHMHDPPPF